MILDHTASRVPDPDRSDKRLSRRQFLQAGAAAFVEVNADEDRVRLVVRNGRAILKRDIGIVGASEQGHESALLQMPLQAMGDIECEILLVNRAANRARILSSVTRIQNDKGEWSRRAGSA